MLLTAAHCVAWEEEATGCMLLDDQHPEPVQFGQNEFKVRLREGLAVSDIAVLGTLDDQTEDSVAWCNWCKSTESVEIDTSDYPAGKQFPVFIFTALNEWVECEAQCYWEKLAVTPNEQIPGGTSGGPVVTADGKLVGVVSHFSEGGNLSGEVYRPHLAVPPWLLRWITMSEIKVDRFDIAPDWCLFKANDEAPKPPENLQFDLHDLFQEWLLRNKELTVRTVLPIVQGGNTVAIHVWFD